MIVLDRSQMESISEAADEAGVEVRESYSGRGMYGRSCVGIVGNSDGLVQFILALGGIDAELARELGSVSSDNMGLQMIYYFPSLQAPRGEGEGEGEGEDEDSSWD